MNLCVQQAGEGHDSLSFSTVLHCLLSPSEFSVDLFYFQMNFFLFSFYVENKQSLPASDSFC